MTSRSTRGPWVVTLVLGAIALGIGAATFAGIGAVWLTTRGPDFIVNVVMVGGCGLLALALLVIFGWPRLMAAEHAARKEHPRMSAITGTEPAHWHDQHGHHRMTDPRTLPGWDSASQSSHWSDADELDYVGHLTEHEHLDQIGEPLADDPPEVRQLLAKVKLDREVIAKQVELVRILRHRHHHTLQEDDNER